MSANRVAVPIILPRHYTVAELTLLQKPMTPKETQYVDEHD